MSVAFKEYAEYDGLGLAELIARGQVSSLEVLEAALERIETFNPIVNAVSIPMEATARDAVMAGLPHGAFRGVPLLLKDLDIANYPGVPTQLNSRLLENYIPDAPSEVVRRLCEVGFVCLGKTRVPNFGFSATTEPVFGGPTRNPWNLDHSAGGSTGGGAAAVAIGMVPIAQATDAAGSLRLPASHCSLFGLKVSRGRVSAAPYGEFAGGFGSAHVLTRTVRDSAAVLDETWRPVPGDPYHAPPPAMRYRTVIERPPHKLRIAFSTASLGRDPTDAACIEATLAAARLCEEMGHVVEEAAPAYDFNQMMNDLALIHGSNVTSRVEALLERRGAGAVTPEDIEAAALSWTALGKSRSAADYAEALKRVHAIGRTMGAFLQRYDLFLTPVAAQPALPLGVLDMGKSHEQGYTEDLFAHMAFTALANASGQPAMSVPIGLTASGLPVGAQFTAPYGREDWLLALAAQFERMQPWITRRPALWGASASGQP